MADLEALIQQVVADLQTHFVDQELSDDEIRQAARHCAETLGKDARVDAYLRILTNRCAQHKLNATTTPPQS